ncbi:DUF6880 family protein [Rhodobaculum claviforme]|uniref:Uncharacterized protein n=1 Tax=Rhodobaculum claviforme TaxID=1549854 RepID=A0A934TL50_9RHOB|nr:DUF6880 family protein [Rhodobaculum claviforme]MBK5927608.1 hypothetical protein [Rhodobaculum claviforme]
MASRTTLNARNLEALGTGPLAQLLMEVTTGNAAARRKLRLALAGAQSPAQAAREIARRLTSIANARGAIGWRKRKAAIDDLATQRRGIVAQVATSDPAEALALMWRFLSVATPVIDRCRGGEEAVIAVFRDACADLGTLVAAVRPDPEALRDAVFEALVDNRFGQCDGLVGVLAPALGDAGLLELHQRFDALCAQPAETPSDIAAWRRRRLARRALQDIADARGDVDGFVAQTAPEQRHVPATALGIARRLRAAGRTEAALAALDAVTDAAPPAEWQTARLEVLEALGRGEAAQAFRWACFERDLSADHLRAYLGKLPDFEDFEAEERAVALAMEHPDLGAAVRFFLDWRAPGRAAEVLIRRRDEIDGTDTEGLSRAAEALEPDQPGAATLALRAMIDAALRQGRSGQYRQAARHLATCAALAPRIDARTPIEDHDTHVARLRREHARKTGFWSRVEG